MWSCSRRKHPQKRRLRPPGPQPPGLMLVPVISRTEEMKNACGFPLLKPGVPQVSIAVDTYFPAAAQPD